MKLSKHKNLFRLVVPLGRTIPGVPYTTLMVLTTGVNGIKAGEPIVSIYVWACQKKKFQFECRNRWCYAAANKPYP